jgi:hypothetical protein
MSLPTLPRPACPKSGTRQPSDLFTTEQMQAHYKKGRADALLDAMNATTPFGKTGAVIAAAIRSLK